ncbi:MULTISPECIES: hypothetical protein [Spirulina sp. CCY15215]|uniref:hypothetical protein n=1 Tax=Spirulina sp. CCY15215 TaxID=2767591 RepID=UPI001951F224|nr:hypothetical protein [Spirulina major]
MIRVTPPPKPSDFDTKVRQPGNAWLAKNLDPKKDPKNYWRHCKSDLANGFHNLCAYSAMYEPVGTVDHYLCTKNYRELAYEWHNYRYASGWINSSKQNLDDRILDPFDVGDNWFEIVLPSLELRLSDRIPDRERKRAEFTLERLHLRDDERVVRQRQEWYRLFIDDGLPLKILEKKAPLIARAVRKQQKHQ